MRRFLLMTGVVMAVVMVAGGVAAQISPDVAIRYRKQVLSAIGAHFGALSVIAQNPGVYDQDLTFHAGAMTALADMPWQAFGAGTDQGAERTTASKKVWEDPEGFVKAQNAFKAEVAKIQAIADANDIKALPDQIKATVATCKACHQTYRD